EPSRPALHRVGPAPRPPLRRRLLQPKGADRGLREQQALHGRSAHDRAQQRDGDRGRDRLAALDDPDKVLMAVVDTDRVKADDAKYVLHSWSVRSAIDPLPVAGGEGRYFWDYDGK